MKIPYTLIFWTAIACYCLNYSVLGGLVISAIFVTSWNAIYESIINFKKNRNKKKGYVTQAEYDALQEEIEKLKEENTNTLSEFIETLREKDEIYEINIDAAKHRATIAGQDAVFKAFVVNQPLFQKFLLDYQKRMDQEKVRQHNRTKPKSSSLSSWRRVLNVPKDADEAAVNAAYKTLVKKFHPDINKSPEASVKMQEINEAKEQAERYFKRVA